MSIRGISAAVFYGASSSSMALINKAVLNTYGFNFPFFIMTCQMLFSLLLLELLKILKQVDLSSYTFARGRQFFWPSISYAFHATLSLIALSRMNIPMYGVLKRCVPLVNLILAIVVLKKGIPSTGVIVSVIIITLGCVIAGIGDLTFNLWAYLACTASVFAQAFYLTLVQRCAEGDFSTTEIMYLNSYNCFPILLALTFVNSELNELVNYKFYTNTGFIIMFVLVVTMGMVLNYSLFLCTSINSALTTSLVGCIKTVVQTVIGIFMFDGIPFSVLNIVGILMNLSGGFLYTYEKFAENRRKHKTTSRLISVDTRPLLVSKPPKDVNSNGIIGADHNLNYPKYVEMSNQDTRKNKKLSWLLGSNVFPSARTRERLHSDITEEEENIT